MIKQSKKLKVIDCLSEYQVRARKRFLLLLGILLDIEYVILLSWPFFVAIAKHTDPGLEKIILFLIALQETLCYSILSKYTSFFVLHKKSSPTTTHQEARTRMWLLLILILLDIEYVILLSWPFFIDIIVHHKHPNFEHTIQFSLAIQGTLCFAILSKYAGYFLDKKVETITARHARIGKRILLLLAILLDVENMILISWSFFSQIVHFDRPPTKDIILFVLAIQGLVCWSVWSKYSAYFLDRTKIRSFKVQYDQLLI